MLSEDLVEQLYRNYRFITPGDLRPVGPLKRNPNLFVLDTGGRKVVLKKHWFLTSARLPGLEAFLWEMCKARLTPETFPTTVGRLFFTWNREHYSVMEYLDAIPGDEPGLPEAAAPVIAGMHRVMAKYPHAGIEPPLAVGPRDLEEVLAQYREGQWMALWKEVEPVKRSPSIRRQLVHNDLHRGNMIRTSSGKVYVVDFDSFSANPLVTDVMFAAFRLSRGDEREFYRFLSEYLRHNTLSDREQECGLLLLAGDFLAKIGFILWENRRGNGFFMKDLEKYGKYLEQTVSMMGRHDPGN